MFLANRGEDKSIMLGTLLAITRQATIHRGGVPAGLSNAIVGSSSEISLATSRFPVFDDDMQSPYHGYYESLCNKESFL